MPYEKYAEITPYLSHLSDLSVKHSKIDPELYTKYEVKRGLRDISGRGVLTGLTEIAEVHSYILVDMEMIPSEGKLYYRGIDVEDIVAGFIADNRFGYEEVSLGRGS